MVANMAVQFWVKSYAIRDVSVWNDNHSCSRRSQVLVYTDYSRFMHAC